MVANCLYNGVFAKNFPRIASEIFEILLMTGNESSYFPELWHAAKVFHF